MGGNGGKTVLKGGRTRERAPQREKEGIFNSLKTSRTLK